LKIYIKGGGEVSLTNKDFVAAGGQGQIYAKGSVAYKIYLDKSGMLPLGKIQELSELTEPCYIKPEQVICNKKGEPLGYTMRFIPNGSPLCQLFTPSFRDREGVTPDQIQGLVQKMQEGVSFAHTKKILLVDLNEFNFLVGSSFKEIFFIDADSYQTPHYPATALMESVKDWHSPKFCELSDWFSFGVLAFQMFVGVHPYRGRYKGSTDAYKKKLPGDDPMDAFSVTRRRMQSHISVFNDQVGVPKSAYPFDVIPASYREWFKSIFEDGKRLPPPGNVGIVMVYAPVTRTITGTKQLEIKELASFEGKITGVWCNLDVVVVVTTQGVWVNNQKLSSDQPTTIGFSTRRNHVIAVTKGDTPTFNNLTSRCEVPFSLHATHVMSYDGRTYIKSHQQILEVVISDIGIQTIASNQVVAHVLEHATRMYPGCVVQELLGSTFVSMFPRSGSSYQIHVKELDTYRIVGAKYDQGVLVVIGETKGQYDRFVFRFSPSHTAYDVRKVEGIPPNSGINFVTLDSGVCLYLNEEEKLELFKADKDSPQVNILEDSILGGDMILTKQGGRVMFYRGNKLYSIKMR